MTSQFEKIQSDELAACAEYEALSIFEHHRRAMEAAENRTHTAEELEMCERAIEAEEAYEWEELDEELSAEDLAKAQADWEAAEDQGHDWNDYDDPIDLYGEDGYFGFNG